MYILHAINTGLLTYTLTKLGDNLTNNDGDILTANSLMSAGQTTNHAKFCGDPTRSVRDISNRKSVLSKSGPKFTKIA